MGWAALSTIEERPHSSGVASRYSTGAVATAFNQPIDQVREQESSVLYLELNLECGVT